ncbi:hypothetical protein [Paludibaculum fermentans]|uniref:Uncharacterized protein n=1 Tax=Paludibaculum fermentans TaxID=1473598 RepID=A0A7S7NVP1_PALFE|nr:hypothetical protein [Paludibaculum fermentans]QOY90646.1 hypothetical protein IRI77_12055 [Paludibaculum fermentans]
MLKLTPGRWASLGALLAIACLAGWWMLLRPATATDLIGLFPDGEAPTLYVDVAALRATGLLEMLAGKAGVEEPEYRKFVEASGFDYRRDLDAVAMRVRSTDTLLVLKGRFDAARLAAYAKANGGRCTPDVCTIQGSAPERQISWIPMKRQMLALAVAQDPLAVALINPAPRSVSRPLPESPVWLEVPGSQLHGGPGLPPGLSALLSSLDGADRAVLTAGVDGVGFALEMKATCPEPAKAKEIAGRLMQMTDMFRKLLARENQKPNPADLSGLLAGGEFAADGLTVRGKWPLSKILLTSMLGK